MICSTGVFKQPWLFWFFLRQGKKNKHLRQPAVNAISSFPLHLLAKPTPV